MTTAKDRVPKDREKRMSLGAHLLELRKRLFISAAGIAAGAIAGFFLAPYVLDALRGPIDAIAEANNAAIVYPTITSSFDLRMQIAITVGIVISSPVWLYQIFAFLVPGLNSREKRYTYGFLGSAIPLFFAGCAAGWFVLPNIVELLTGFVPDEDQTLLDAKLYFDFVLKLVVAIGVAFVLPVFIVLLNFAGVISAASILRSWRIAILVITLFTAFATPAADIISMFLLAIPMIGLYFAAWFIAHLHDRRVERRQRLEFGTAV